MPVSICDRRRTRMTVLATILSLAGWNATAARSKMTAEEMLTKIHAANQEEIAMGELARDKAQSAKVKSLAESLIKDHTEAEKKVTDLASSKNLDLTRNLPQVVSESTTMGELKMLSADKFDHAFVRIARKQHQKLISQLESSDTDDAQVAELKRKLIPELKEHLRISQRLENLPSK